MNIANELRKIQHDAQQRGQSVSFEALAVIVDELQQGLDNEIHALHDIVDKFYEGSDFIERAREGTYSYREGVKLLDQARKEIKQLDKNKADTRVVVNAPAMEVS